MTSKNNQSWTTVESRKDKKLRKQQYQEQQLKDSQVEKVIIPSVTVVNLTEEQKQISKLQEQIKTLEERVTMLEHSQPQPCPNCSRCVEPIIKTTTDRWIGGVGRRLTVCPSCDHLYHYTF